MKRSTKNCVAYGCNNVLSVVTGQLADMPTRRQPTRTQVKSRTIQLAHRSTRTQDN